MGKETLCKWNIHDIDALTISSSTHKGNCRLLYVSKEAVDQYKDPLTHGLQYSESVELTLFTFVCKSLIYYTKFENGLLSFLTFKKDACLSVC